MEPTDFAPAGGLIAGERQKEGYLREHQFEAALPMPVWRVDLEIESEKLVSAAELTVLGAIGAGISDIEALTRALGMGKDVRLAERVLVKLLSAGAVDTFGDGFCVTTTGELWKAAGSALGRERVTYEVRVDPVLGQLEWVDGERAVFSTDETWTIELPPVGDAALLARKVDLGELVRRDGLPDEGEKSPAERRGKIDLRGVTVVGRRIHWRAVRLDVWRHPIRLDYQIIGYIGDAENPPLTTLLAKYAVQVERKRVRPRR